MKEPTWIELRDALAIHNRLLGIDGGASGLRDLGLLESALALPRQILAYGEKPDMPALSAAYTSGIVGNHPFVDGNKRTGFLLGILFLELNGFSFAASQESATQVIISLAAREMTESAFTSWVLANTTRTRRSAIW
jgi:death-on-curing protein